MPYKVLKLCYTGIGAFLQYFMPVVPVIVSWIISTVALYRSMNLANASEQGITYTRNWINTV